MTFLYLLLVLHICITIQKFNFPCGHKMIRHSAFFPFEPQIRRQKSNLGPKLWQIWKSNCILISELQKYMLLNLCQFYLSVFFDLNYKNILRKKVPPFTMPLFISIPTKFSSISISTYLFIDWHTEILILDL